MNKHCNKCDRDLPLENFSFRDKKTGVYNRYCKGCFAAYNRKYYSGEGMKAQVKRTRAHRANIFDTYSEWKARLSCRVCGEDNTACLDLHHIDPGDKDDIIAKIIAYGSLKKLWHEVAKCIVLCSNCHRKLHAGKLSLCGDSGDGSVS